MLACCFLRLHSSIIYAFWVVKAFNLFFLLVLVYLRSIFVLESAFEQLESLVNCCSVDVETSRCSWRLRHVLLLLFQFSLRNALVGGEGLSSHLLLIHAYRTLLDAYKLFGRVCFLYYFAFDASLSRFVWVNNSRNLLTLFRDINLCWRLFRLISILGRCLRHWACSVVIQRFKRASLVHTGQLWCRCLLAPAFFCLAARCVFNFGCRQSLYFVHGN